MYFLIIPMFQLIIRLQSAPSERSVWGRKNRMFHNTANGANSSALVRSISEIAKLNNLGPYYYFRYILTELPKHCVEKGMQNLTT